MKHVMPPFSIFRGGGVGEDIDILYDSDLVKKSLKSNVKLL